MFKFLRIKGWTNVNSGKLITGLKGGGKPSNGNQPRECLFVSVVWFSKGVRLSPRRMYGVCTCTCLFPCICTLCVCLRAGLTQSGKLP